MFKEKILSVCCLFLMGFVTISCSDSDDGDDIFPVEKHPLTAFAVKVGDSYYHGKIDQDAHRVEIGMIEDASTITDVAYTLEDDSAKIVPNPATFINNWKKEQQVTVTTQSNEVATYTIVLTKYKEVVSNIIFEDNFEVDGNPDPTKWVLCKKGPSDWNDEMSESYDQAYVRDGNLILTAIKDGDTYKAGGIESQGKFDFTFGKVEARARITKHPNGAFPAIWLMPSKFIYPGWPACGEIDIMEHLNQDAFIYSTIHTHYTNTLNKVQEYPKFATPACNVDEYNVYGMEWTPEKITFFLNDKEVFSYPNLHLENEAEMKQWPFTADSKWYIILNMGLGGRPGSWAGQIDDANMPAEMQIDWVRVSRLEE